MDRLRTCTRTVSITGLAAAGLLHLSWAAGSSWPAADPGTLARHVVGGDRAPGTLPTVAVGATLLGAGALVAGPDRWPPTRWARRAVVAALLARSVVGGVPAARALGVGDPDPAFRSLDRRLYRPLCAVLGLATLTAGRVG